MKPEPLSQEFQLAEGHGRRRYAETLDYKITHIDSLAVKMFTLPNMPTIDSEVHIFL